HIADPAPPIPRAARRPFIEDRNAPNASDAIFNVTALSAHATSNCLDQCKQDLAENDPTADSFTITMIEHILWMTTVKRRLKGTSNHRFPIGTHDDSTEDAYFLAKPIHVPARPLTWPPITKTTGITQPATQN